MITFAKPKRPKLPVTIGGFTLDHYSDTKYFSVYEKNVNQNTETLVCVCVYRCGAEEVIKRFNNKEVTKK